MVSSLPGAMVRKRILAVLGVLSVFCVVPVRGDVVYSNFGLGMSFDNDPNDGWGINGFIDPNGGQQAIGEQFTPTGNYTFTDAQVAVALSGGPDSIDVFLQADSNGVPGTVIEEIPISGLGPTAAILTATSGLFPALTKGTPYWLTLVAGADGVVAGWNLNSIGDVSAAFAFTDAGTPVGPWDTGVLQIRGAFEIDGTQLVPEPSTLLLLGWVLMTLACRLWRRQLP